ncbi:MAG: hypothetical protein GY699_09500 [Desulfobacteraceae bacterium]|nr:hypothetical protein [Desulfobacteraceae bacterium]
MGLDVYSRDYDDWKLSTPLHYDEEDVEEIYSCKGCKYHGRNGGHCSGTRVCVEYEEFDAYE